MTYSNKHTYKGKHTHTHTDGSEASYVTTLYRQGLQQQHSATWWLGSHILSDTHTHTLSLTHTHTLSLSHTLSHSHTHTPKPLSAVGLWSEVPVCWWLKCVFEMLFLQVCKIWVWPTQYAVICVEKPHLWATGLSWESEGASALNLWLGKRPGTTHTPCRLPLPEHCCELHPRHCTLTAGSHSQSTAVGCTPRPERTSPPLNPTPL